MAENEYLSQMQARLAEAKRTKEVADQQATADQAAALAVEKEQKTESGLETHQTSLETAETKHKEVAELTTLLAQHEAEVAEFENLAPQLKELGIEDPDFQVKFDEAKAKISQTNEKLAAARAGEDSAAETAAQAAADPEVNRRLHEEALAENNSRELEFRLKELNTLFDSIKASLSTELKKIFAEAYVEANAQLDDKNKIKNPDAQADLTVSQLNYEHFFSQLANYAHSFQEAMRRVEYRLTHANDAEPEYRKITARIMKQKLSDGLNVFPGELGERLNKFYNLREEFEQKQEESQKRVA